VKFPSKAALVGVIVLVVFLGYTGLSRDRTMQAESAAASQTSAPKNKVDRSVSTSASPTELSSPRAGGVASLPDAGSAITLKQMAGEPHLASLLNEVRRSSDVMVQEFAVFAPSRLCSELRMATTDGFQPLVEAKRELLATVTLALKPQADIAVAQVAQRCSDYRRDGLLRDQLAAELWKAGAPVSVAAAAIPVVTDPADQEVRLAKVRAPFAAVFAGDDLPIKLQLLKGTVSFWGQRWVANVVPEMYRADALFLSGIAMDIAACRAGATCDSTSIARASLCVRYGECTAPDVEASYRRLHTLYQVPFEMTEKLVQRYETAIRTKNSQLVLSST
jgi:hypothetical protein